MIESENSTVLTKPLAEFCFFTIILYTYLREKGKTVHLKDNPYMPRRLQMTYGMN